MKIKNLNCPNCNAKIDINPEDTYGKCSYCDTPFILEDETIKIEHEIIDNTSLKVAETTLNKFKDYKKAELLYKMLLFKYAHKEEIYIGLIRSMTEDFKKEITELYKLNEINDYWQKYTALSPKQNISKYSEKINEMNKNYWITTLKNLTQEFTFFSLKLNPFMIESAWNKFVLFSEEKEHKPLESKYKTYLKNLNEYQIKEKARRKKIKFITIAIILFLILATTIYITTESPKLKEKEIKTSEIYKYCNSEISCTDKSFIKDKFYPTIGELTINKLSLNKEENTLTIIVNFKEETKEYKLKIIDDQGPTIEPTNCSFTDTEEIDLTKCFTITDYTDGNIDSKKATINENNENFKVIGQKKIIVTAEDKDKNKETKDIIVTITKTPITLKLNLAKNKIQINETTTYSHEITPNVNNKEIELTYDKNYITINNNVITPIKIGDTEICATTKYDSSITYCTKLEITPICKNSYTFSFESSKDEIITGGTDFCPGTYRIYLGVLNSNKTYFLHQKSSTGSTNIITVNKTSPFNEEGGLYSFEKGTTLKLPIGVTSITLNK